MAVFQDVGDARRWIRGIYRYVRAAGFEDTEETGDQRGGAVQQQPHPVVGLDRVGGAQEVGDLVGLGVQVAIGQLLGTADHGDAFGVLVGLLFEQRHDGLFVRIVGCGVVEGVEHLPAFPGGQDVQRRH